MPSTFVHALLPSACLFTLWQSFPKLSRTQLLKFLFLSVVLGNAPDLDIIPASIWYHSWEKIHREWGHNVFSVAFAIWAGSQLIRAWVSPEISKRMAWAIASCLVLSHLLLDGLHAPNQLGHLCGLPLFWPFTDAEFRLPYEVFPAVKIDRSIHFLWAHVSSRQFWHQAVFLEASGAALMYGLFLGVVVLWQTLRVWAKRAKTDYPSAQSSPQCSRVIPLPRRPDGNPPRTCTDFESAS